MKVIVSRASGDNPSPDVLVDVLCTEENIAVLKGKAYLYDNGFDTLILQLELKIPEMFVCGDIVEFFDTDYGVSTKGRITNWKNTCMCNSDGTNIFSQQIIIEKKIVVD